MNDLIALRFGASTGEGDEHQHREAINMVSDAEQPRDLTIEQEIQAKGLTAPRVTPEQIAARIKSEHYFTAGNGAAHPSALSIGNLDGSIDALCVMTFCVLVLANGFTVTGESACASPENFDANLGRKIARQNAVNKIWPLEGYRLKQDLYEGTNRAPAQPLPVDPCSTKGV